MKAIYLAGPDVFLPNAVAHARKKIDICAQHGLVGRAPLNEEVGDLRALPQAAAWRTIFAKDLLMMEACDAVIANLTPFRGASADSGTLVELGWFLGQGRPVFGYSNTATPFADRSREQVRAVPDPLPGLMVEGFALPDNLMIPGAVERGGGLPMVLPEDGIDRAFDSLEVFALCVAQAAAALGTRSG